MKLLFDFYEDFNAIYNTVVSDTSINFPVEKVFIYYTKRK